MKRTRKLWVWLLALVMIFSLLPATAFAEDGTEPGSGTEEEASIEFIGVSGQSYKINAGLVGELAHTEVVRWKDVTETAAYLKDVLEAVGAGEDLGDCSYTLTATDGYTASLDADWYDDFGLFLENGAPRFVLMDSTLIQGGWYSPAPLVTIEAKNHSYDENGACDNPINIGKGQTEPCGAESSIEFIGASGESYVISSSVVRQLATTEVERWKGVLVTAAYMKDVLEAVGAAEDLGECSYELVATDGYSAALDADWYDNFGLFMDGGIPRFVLMDSTLIQGGWYSPAPLATITAKNHVHGEGGICDNPINVGKGQTENCGENTHAAGEAKEETIAATYAEAEHIASVVRCSICNEVLESTFVRETGVKSLKDQAVDAIAAYEEAKAEAEKYTGEAAVAPAEAALEAANAAKAAASAAYAAAVEEGLDETTLAEAAAAIEAADQAIAEAKEVVAADKAAAIEAADVRDTAVASLAQLDNQVDPSAYTAGTYAVYEEAYNAFKELTLDDNATADQLRSARSAVTKAYIRLVPKGEQTLTTTTKGGSKGYAALAEAKATFTLVTVKGNEGALTFTKSSGSSYATVNKTTGAVTLEKGAPAGSYAIKIKITAAATDDYLKATKTVTVKITVSKAEQPMVVKTTAKSTTVAKTKAGKVTVSGAITVTKAQGTVTYTKDSGSKYLTVNKSTGKIVVAKGTPAGKYTIKVKIKAAGNKNYKAKTVTKTITVTVKK